MTILQVETSQSTFPSLGELHRLTLEVYRSMGELGLLSPDDRVELLDGLLVKKMTKGPRHVSANYRLIGLLNGRLPAGWSIRKEDPIELPGGPQRPDSAPEPDIVVVMGDHRNYADRHPGPGEVALVVEVAGSLDMVTRDRKGLARYAWAGIPIVWILNLVNETVEVYSNPSGMGPDPLHGSCTVHAIGTGLSLTLGGETI